MASNNDTFCSSIILYSLLSSCTQPHRVHLCDQQHRPDVRVSLLRLGHKNVWLSSWTFSLPLPLLPFSTSSTSCSLSPSPTSPSPFYSFSLSLSLHLTPSLFPPTFLSYCEEGSCHILGHSKAL